MSKSKEATNTLRIVVVDHKTLVTAGIRASFEAAPGFEVIREIPLELKTATFNALQEADLLLICLTMAVYQEVELAERIMEKRPELPVVVLTVNNSREYVLQMLEAGVKAVLCQKSTQDELLEAVRAAAKGEIYLALSLPDEVKAACRQYLKQPAHRNEALTIRQKTILKLIAEGRNTKEIAHRLKLSSKTVEFHRARLMERLGIFDVAGLVRYAIRAGLVQV